MTAISLTGPGQRTASFKDRFADIVFRNAVAYTADRRQPWANAVAVRAEKIVYVGSSDGAGPFIGPQTELLDLKGKFILPGFRDAHIHPLTGSLNLLECRLIGPADLSAYLSQIAAYAKANEDQSFIRGGGWLPDAFPACGPNRKDLDAVVAGRPVFLKSIDGHSAWVNTKTLAIAGITRDTADPPGGLIERDPVTGEATGTLREWSAMALALAESCLPAPTPKDMTTAAWAFMEMAVKFGIVSVHEAMAKQDELSAYRDLDLSEELTLRVQAALLCEPELGMDQIDALCEKRQAFQGRLLSPRAVKIFIDGVVEGHTAWLLAPYADRPGFHGERLWSPDKLNHIVSTLDRAGFQIHFHAVGDGAVRMGLDALACARRTNGRRHARHMIAHCDLIDAKDLPRFRTLGVIANVQPIWFYQEKNYESTTLPFLGAQRAFGLYAMRRLLKNGTTVVCGSDWPFSGELNTFNPLVSIQVGVTRVGLDDGAAPAYTPDECVDLATMNRLPYHSQCLCRFSGRPDRVAHGREVRRSDRPGSQSV